MPVWSFCAVRSSCEEEFGAVGTRLTIPRTELIACGDERHWEVFFDRDVGYAFERIELDTDIEAISATQVRQQLAAT